MQELIIDNKEEIQQELTALGFSNTNDILSTAVPLYNRQNSSPKGIYMDDLYVGAGSNDIGFVFIFGQKNTNATWKIESVRFAVDVPTDRLPNGFKPFTRTWNLSDGPLPHRERMRWEVNRAAKIEGAKESFLFNPEPIPTISANATQVMSSMDKGLEAELKRLGLPHYPQIAQSATFQENIAFLKSQEKIDPRRFQGANALDLFFAVVYPENKIPLRIEYMNASLARDGPGNRDLRILTEINYWLANGPLPTKDQIIRDIKLKLDLSTGRLEKAAKIASACKSQSFGRGLHH